MDKQVQYDVSSYEVITAAIIDLLNAYPGLADGETIGFATLDEDCGKAMFPQGGAIIMSDKTDIMGEHYQTCQYPFYVFYRAGGLTDSRRAAVKEWLDNLGCWLEGQQITAGGTTAELTKYPTLSGNREFTQIKRQSPAFLNGVNENNTEDWAITISAQYTNTFKSMR